MNSLSDELFQIFESDINPSILGALAKGFQVYAFFRANLDVPRFHGVVRSHDENQGWQAESLSFFEPQTSH